MMSCNFYRGMVMNERDSRYIGRTPIHGIARRTRRTGWQIVLLMCVVLCFAVALFQDLQ